MNKRARHQVSWEYALVEAAGMKEERLRIAGERAALEKELREQLGGPVRSAFDDTTVRNLAAMEMLEFDMPVNPTAVGEHRWTNVQLKRELQLHNLALGADDGARGDDLLAALAKEGVKLASGVPAAVAPYRLGSGDASVTEKVHLTEQLAGILAAQKHVASQGDDARAQTNDV